MILVFVDPTATFLGLDHEFVITEPGIYERVDKASSKITASRFNVGR